MPHERPCDMAETSSALAAGIIVGALVGGIIALLAAPMTGRRLRALLGEFIQTLPERVEEEMEPDSKTRRFLDRARVRFENRVEEAQHARHARRLAHAKEREEFSYGLDL